MNRSWLFQVVLLFCSGFASAQIIESNGSGGGNWNDPLTWQGGIIPTASNSTQINIRTGDIVNIPSGFTAVADQLFVRESATLSVLSGGTLNIVNGSGNDLVLINNGALFGQLNVSGRLEFSHGATAVEGGAVPSSNTTATTMKILNGGVYNHGYTTYSGSIIGAEWQDGSVLEITSLTSASQIPSNLNQSFFDVVWNCPLQSKQLNLGGNLSEVRGTFRILSTGSQVLYIFGSQSSVILNIAGNFEISGNASVIFSTGNSNVISIGGDFIISTSSSTVQLARAGSLTINVLNSMNITSNTVLAAVSGNLSLNLTGDLVMSGNFAVQSGGVANLLFNGSSQNLAGSSFSGLFNFTIGSGATLNLGSHFLVSPGTFTMQSASTIMVGSSSPGGAIAANTSEGNIRIPVANRTYNANSRIVYNNGSVPQFLSSGHPSSSNVTTVISNPQDVNLVGNCTLSGPVELDGGNLIVGATTLTLQSPITVLSGFIDVSTSSNITVSGSGAFGNLPLTADGTLNNLTVNRSGATVSLMSNLTIGGNLGLNNGSLGFSDNTLTLTGSMSRTNGNLSSNSNSTLIIEGSGSLATAFLFNSLANTLGTLILNRPSSTIGISGHLNIVNELRLLNGNLNNTGGLTLLNNATIVRGNSTLLFNRVSKSPGDGYNVIYTPGGSIFTGLELPLASDEDGLLNLSIQSGSVSLSQSVIVNGNISLDGGTFSAGNHTITMKGSNWAFNAGTFNPGTGTTIFRPVNGIISGNGTKIFRQLLVDTDATLSFPDDQITLEGNLTVAAGAVLNTNFSTLLLSNNATQSISANGTVFNNITVNKSSGSVTLINSLNIQGILSIQTPTVFNSNGHLTILSTNDHPAMDGSIAALPVGASVNGNVTVQRYFSAIDDRNRFFSAPVSTATVAQLQQAFAVTGNFEGTSFPCEGCKNNGASLKWYDESVTGTFDKGYQNFPGSSGSSATQLVVGRGYDAWMWNGVAPTSINYVGPVNQGSIALGAGAITHTVSSPVQPAADGWNLVGNPYPSAVQWNNTGWSRTNIDPVVWVWDVMGSTWFSYNANTGVGNLSNGVIASGQAFWVYVPTPGAASLTIHESAKSLAGSGSYYRRDNVTSNILLRHDVSEDRIYILLDDAAGTGFDPGLDAYKLQLGIERMSLSVLEGTNKFGHYAIGATGLDIPLYLYAARQGVYSLSFENFDIPEWEGYHLFDTETGEFISVQSGKTYQFQVSAAPYESGKRFLLSRQIALQTENTVQLSVYPNPVQDRLFIEWQGHSLQAIKLLDALGRQVQSIDFRVENGKTYAELDMQNFEKGFYLLQFLEGKRVKTHKLIKQ